jgi:hypothetical protein
MVSTYAINVSKFSTFIDTLLKHVYGIDMNPKRVDKTRG